MEVIELGYREWSDKSAEGSNRNISIEQTDDIIMLDYREWSDKEYRTGRDISIACNSGIEFIDLIDLVHKST
jgi:hypothetical protein